MVLTSHASPVWLTSKMFARGYHSGSQQLMA